MQKFPIIGSFVALAALLTTLWPGVGHAGPVTPAAPTPSAAAAVRRADAGLAAAASAANADAWLAYYADDAILLTPQGGLVKGKAAIRVALGMLVQRDPQGLAWQPQRLRVDASGDLAYLHGPYHWTFSRSAADRGESDQGMRSEIWRRRSDGTWICLVDLWSAGAGPGAGANAGADGAAASAGAEDAVTTAGAARSAVASPVSAAIHDPKYGDAPVHYRQAIVGYFDAHLRDPESVRFREVSAPERGSQRMITGALLMHEVRRHGWVVRATIDAKDARGTYVGDKTYRFLFRGERIVNVVSPFPSGEMK